jgi:hypothetical protein
LDPCDERGEEHTTQFTIDRRPGQGPQVGDGHLVAGHPSVSSQKDWFCHGLITAPKQL